MNYSLKCNIFFFPSLYQKDIVIHELGHAIGFNHEQTRPDRDQYVQIYLENVNRTKRHNFKKYDNDHTNTFSVPYDYYSVMHYGKKVSFIDR